MAFLTRRRGKTGLLPIAIVRLCCQLVFPVLLAGFTGSVAGGQPIDEYHTKAAFLYNFIRFVDWPPEAFQTPNDAFAICVLGHDPFGQALNDAVADKVVAGRSVIVRVVPDVYRRGRCQILFIGSSEPKEVASALRETRASCILTVGEADDFAMKG